MISARSAGILGIVACALFWAAMFTLAALRPSYSHSTNAISELGALGTPNAWLWNVLGFVIPGLLLAITGHSMVASIDTQQTRSGWLADWLLPAFGLTVAGQGLVPAVMVDGQPLVTSWVTRGHLILSLISGVAWLVALLLLITPMKRSSGWRGWDILNIAAVFLVIASAFILGGRLPGGLAQRLVDAIVFAWFLIVSIRLIRLRKLPQPESQRGYP
jgi:hypothetical protein